MRPLPFLASLALVAVAALSGCATTTAPTTIADTAARTPQLSTLNRLINEAGLSETLRGPGPFTLFAPTDEAFKVVPSATMQALATDKALLQSVLSYHLVPGKLPAADAKVGGLKTVQGANMAVARSGGTLTVEDAVVQETDVPASNGVVHIVDRVLMPPKQ